MNGKICRVISSSKTWHIETGVSVITPPLGVSVYSGIPQSSRLQVNKVFR